MIWLEAGFLFRLSRTETQILRVLLEEDKLTPWGLHARIYGTNVDRYASLLVLVFNLRRRLRRYGIEIDTIRNVYGGYYHIRPEMREKLSVVVAQLLSVDAQSPLPASVSQLNHSDVLAEHQYAGKLKQES